MVSVEPTLVISTRLMSCINQCNIFVLECEIEWMSASLCTLNVYILQKKSKKKVVLCFNGTEPGIEEMLIYSSLFPDVIRNCL